MESGVEGCTSCHYNVIKLTTVWSVVLKVAVCCISRAIFKLMTVWSVMLKVTTRSDWNSDI